jgi:hypothetical protein
LQRSTDEFHDVARYLVIGTTKELVNDRVVDNTSPVERDTDS